MRKRTNKPKREWHLYSAVVVTAVVLFMSIQSTPTGSTTQVLAAAFSGIVGTFLFVSQEWKAVPERIHMWTIGIAITVVLIWPILLKFWYARNSHKVLKINSDE